ncbi:MULTISPECIES: sensor histidine kinase [Paenibacillus]|uniref:Sensor histidine kinase n=2 Tax=Paenibacillus TaxID=44249 RepID=A0A1R0WXM4_9BACL|nr:MULTISPECIES: sensor histidine kinase [Paenibacillus]AIQ75613.1 histidine kinase [Paenibacillus odorifer]ETT68306.1 signal transduction histidine kinase [Paenibacillus sp. FSL H8-237]MEC0132774.1 sensor histidine kinase [Paenibacillus odorifer]MEC0224475.1 sensor histidine kinase [Paenibacillus odorifer]OMC97214.1 two-component sensor histidine kinase [Paenibacillus odorifer]
MTPGMDLRSLLMTKLFENSSEAMFFFDRQGKALAMNPAAENIVDQDILKQLYQGNPEALCGTCRGYTSETELRTCLNCYFHTPDSEEFTSYQVYLETKDKGIVPYAATFHTIDDENGIRVFMLRDLSRQFTTQEKFYQNKMMKHIIEAQENERKRISRELHDSVAQELMSAVIDLRVLKYMTADEQLLKKVKQTEVSMTRLLNDIRNLSVELRPAALDDFGLEAAFRSHFKRMEQSYGLIIEYESRLLEKRYESEIETVMYRVCQEAVLNALKYAQVDSVKVSLTENDGVLRLLIKDEGTGFIQGDEPNGTGLGLFGMQERAELVGGTFTVDSGIGRGTTIILQVPVGLSRGKE